jgi:serine/threonine protein kinase
MLERAQREGRSVSALLLDLGVMAQHTIYAREKEFERSTPHETIAGYRLIRKIGQGGMGSVYQADQLSLKREVALKIIAPHIAEDAESVERFLRESRVAAAINHPNVISVIDAGQDAGVLYIALEYVTGGDAGQLASRFNGSVPEVRALEIARDVCQGLEALYRAHLIHRDIKPANIFITSQGQAKPADLGLARREKGDEKLTVSGFAVGTPAYMSPEQAGGKGDLDIRSDLYSVGATLFHLVTGSAPFTGKGPFAIAAKVINEKAPDPRAIMPSRSPATGSVINRALAKQSKDRFQAPAEMLHAIDDALMHASHVSGARDRASHRVGTPVSEPTAITIQNAIPAAPHPGPRPSRERTLPRKGVHARRRPSTMRLPANLAAIAATVVIGVMAMFLAAGHQRTSERTTEPIQHAVVAGAPAPGDSPATSNAHTQPPSHPASGRPEGPAAPQGSSLIDGLVAYWPFDDASGSIAADASGHGNIGTISNGV